MVTLSNPTLVRVWFYDGELKILASSGFLRSILRRKFTDFTEVVAAYFMGYLP
jgi:hypothetical protein